MSEKSIRSASKNLMPNHGEGHGALKQLYIGLDIFTYPKNQPKRPATIASIGTNIIPRNQYLFIVLKQLSPHCNITDPNTRTERGIAIEYRPESLRLPPPDFSL